MNKPLDITLYNKVKREANQKYKTHGAYKSGWIVKTYKERGGRYKGKKPKKGYPHGLEKIGVMLQVINSILYIVLLRR